MIKKPQWLFNITDTKFNLIPSAWIIITVKNMQNVFSWNQYRH